MGILAQRMKELRLEKKMKQVEVAEAIGVSSTANSNYE